MNDLKSVAMMEQHGGCQFWPKSEKPVERFEVSRHEVASVDRRIGLKVEILLNRALGMQVLFPVGMRSLSRYLLADQRDPFLLIRQRWPTQS